MNLFSMTAYAAEESGLEKALENVTSEQAFISGTVMGITLGTVIMIGLVWFILQVIADWKIFTKAGRPGWKCIIPFLNYYEEFDLSWRGRGMLGIVYCVLLIIANAVDGVTADPTPTWSVCLMGAVSIVALVLLFKQSMRLARAFGKGTGFGIGLFLLGPIFRLILGFGSAEYQGAQN